jgi:hypothetical protein
MPTLTRRDGRAVDPLTYLHLFKETASYLDDQKWSGQPVTISIELNAPLLVNGKPPAAMKLSAQVRRIEQEVGLATVLAYSDAAANTTEAELGRFDLGTSELIEHGDELTATFDFSTMRVPENCIFDKILFDAGRVMHMKGMHFIGAATTLSYNIPIELRYIKADSLPP